MFALVNSKFASPHTAPSSAVSRRGGAAQPMWHDAPRRESRRGASRHNAHTPTSICDLVDVVLHFEQIRVCSLKHFTMLSADLRDVVCALFHLMSMTATNTEPPALLENERGRARRTALSIRWNGFVRFIERPSEFESPKRAVVVFLKQTIAKPRTWRVTCGCPHRANSCRPPDAPYRLHSLTIKRHPDVVHDLAHGSGESNSFHTQTTAF